MFALWVVLGLVVAVVTAFCALIGAFKLKPGFWLFSGAALDVVLYILLLGIPSGGPLS